MTIPSFSTDSLYKFMFIAGATILTVSLVLLGEEVLEYNNTIDKLRDSATTELPLQSTIDSVVRRIKWCFSLCITGILVGGLLMIIGGKLWYFKLQKYQDKMIKMEVELKEMELADKKSLSAYKNLPYGAVQENQILKEKVAKLEETNE